MQVRPPLRSLALAVVASTLVLLASCIPTAPERPSPIASISHAPGTLELAGAVGGDALATLTVSASASVRIAATPSAPWLDVAPETAPGEPGAGAEFAVRASCGDTAAVRVAWVVVTGGSEEAVVPVRLACRPAGDGRPDDADEGALERDDPTLLRWEPPLLDAPVLLRLDTEPGALHLDPDTDYLIVLPDRPLVRGINVRGGRNLIVMGGEIAIPWQGPSPSVSSRRAVHISHATGTVHLEGLLIHGDDLSEGIQINAPEAIVQIQNVGIYGIRARDQVDFSDNHPDLIQSYGNAREIRVDRFTGSTDYQGFFFQADFHGPRHGPVRLSRVNIIGEPTARYLLWFAPDAGDIELDDVWLDVPDTRPGGLGRAVWPDVDAATPGRPQVDVDVDASRRADAGERLAGRAFLAWPDAVSPAVAGRVYEGRPPEGDFVLAEGVGIGYRSPGYRPPASRASDDPTARATP